MTILSRVAAGEVNRARIAHALGGTVFTTALAVMFGLSVLVEVSNVPEVAPRAGGPAVFVQAAAKGSAPASRQADEWGAEGQPAAY